MTTSGVLKTLKLLLPNVLQILLFTLEYQPVINLLTGSCFTANHRDTRSHSNAMVETAPWSKVYTESLKSNPQPQANYEASALTLCNIYMYM